MEALRSQPTTPGQIELDGIFAEGLLDVQLGEADPDDAWEASRDRAEELFATMSDSPLQETDAR